MKEVGWQKSDACVNERMGDRDVEKNSSPWESLHLPFLPKPLCFLFNSFPLSVQLYILSKYALTNLSGALGFDINVK